MQIPYIVATRVAGDLYEMLSPAPTFTERSTWSQVCALADGEGATMVVVHNNYRGPGELDRMTYRPAAGVHFADMRHPSMARHAELTRAE